MPSCNSASSQSSRVFAPHVILQQDTTRLAITLKSGEGYTLAGGLIAGDVIRYDPGDLSYKKSQANTDENAEVVGVIESGSSSLYTVIVSGSINYPQARLNAIVDGGPDGKKDILFLDDAVAGGLTGSINVGEGVKIVKPVVQVAPHGQYNAVVVNYIGYKTGTQPTAEGMPSPPTGSVVFAPEGAGNDVYIPLDADQTLLYSDNPDVYAFFGTTYGPWLEKLTITSGVLTAGLATNNAQAYQLKNGVKVNAGYVEIVDTVNNIVYIRKAANISAMNSTIGGFYINGVGYGYSSSEIQDFFVPKVEAPNITQGGDALIPYLKISDPTAVSLPTDIAANSFTADTSIIVDSVDVGAKLAELEYKINLLNARVSAF